jgi:dienelactone hydrolase
LRKLPDVNPRKVAIVAHSFGGSLTILQAAKEPDLRAIVVFSGPAIVGIGRRSSERGFSLQWTTSGPVLFIHAANDYSVNPGRVLDARLAQLGKPHRLKIYPPTGRTPDDGHNFPLLGVTIWAPDVFAFIDEQMEK